VTITSKKSAKYQALLGLPVEVRIRAGILEHEGSASHKDSDMSVAALGMIHEFGLGVPERSFIRAWYDVRQPQIKQALLTAFAAGVPPAVAAGRAALKLESMIKEWINEKVNLTPNAPATIARKGSDVPLVDTSVLRSAITAVAEVGGSK
jgi:hypothetical protein